MTIPTNDGTAPPPGLSKKQIEAVHAARALNAESPAMAGVSVDVGYVADLLDAYDTLAARFAWLASARLDEDR